MAAAAQSLRLALRCSSRRVAPRIQLARPQKLTVARPFSTTPLRRAEEEDPQEVEEEVRIFDNPGDALQELLRTGELSEEEQLDAVEAQKAWEQLPIEEKQKIIADVKGVREHIAPLRRPVPKPKNSFWNVDEKDTEMITNEVGEDEFDEDEITSMGHAKLEEHREFREYARIAVWEMPLLAKLAKPFKPPTNEHVLRFRYTSYMGEFHPAEKKVVVQFCPDDLGLTKQQQLKLAKIAGSRYNPETNIIKMSCEMFEHQAQNKRYLGDLVEKMIATAKDPTDTFEDIPLDTRHHTFTKKPKFPKEWRLTAERQAQIEEQRKQALLLDETKRREGSLIDGVERIQYALAGPSRDEMDGRVAELVSAPRSSAKTRGANFRR
ncbi:37S ribosomal protein S24, mitochondrial [Coniochaeta pulveracea]|uniref:37S ribosomal protein S24, mitochondrial n=1 Tax=Coniochaeta pulveracea TaxID=177199 RepID=A0A420YFB4_9PEZI|nr:37S ribosomal protein S24, mitochondrial [Coniochaeta pulveracea]